jgi:NAD-dependent SIR2 family protein deacetylase
MEDVMHAGPAGQQAEVELGDGTFGSLVKTLGNGGAVVLSGAGLSTESGIPDYRGPSGQARSAQPMTYQAFTGSGQARQRYWARSHLGWRHIAGAAPNAGHRAVAELQRRGLVSGIITQNVDGLHQAAGAISVTELHGSLHRVTCLGCWQRTSRLSLDTRLRTANPTWGFGRGPLLPPGHEGSAHEDSGHEGSGHENDGHEKDGPAVNPDGDVALDDTDGFAVVDCLACGGVLKPDVVFFGENVPRVRVDECYALVSGASSLVVLGSSLTVFSGLRYVRHAAKLGIPVVIVNQGATRGDDLAVVRLDAPLGRTLTAAVEALSSKAGIS